MKDATIKKRWGVLNRMGKLYAQHFRTKEIAEETVVKWGFELKSVYGPFRVIPIEIHFVDEKAPKA